MGKSTEKKKRGLKEALDQIESARILPEFDKNSAVQQSILNRTEITPEIAYKIFDKTIDPHNKMSTLTKFKVFMDTLIEVQEEKLYISGLPEFNVPEL